MRRFIYAGLLYLVGVAALLAWRPEMMFTRDGNWKEFGLGRNPDRYTWFPFWMFAIAWAMVSYTLILVIVGPYDSSDDIMPIKNLVDTTAETLRPANLSTKPLRPAKTTPDELKPGYYILDANETNKRGIPKYIFLGPESPQLIYRNETSLDNGDGDGDD